MLKITILILSALCPLYTLALSMSVYMPSSTTELLDGDAIRVLTNKMDAAITQAGAFPTPNSRFVLVPKVGVVDETSSASIPAKHIVKIEVILCVGDGMEGQLYSTLSSSYKGVGDDRSAALRAAIAKINPRSKDISILINDVEDRVISFYNQSGDKAINDAKKYASLQKYEDAVDCLDAIPPGCKYYGEAQKLLLNYLGKILERDNLFWLNKARSAWGASRDIAGADEARKYLDKIVITNSNEQNAVNDLISQMNSGIEKYNKNQHELELRQIESNTAIQCAQTEARAKIISSVASSAASILSNILMW